MVHVFTSLQPEWKKKNPAKKNPTSWIVGVISKCKKKVTTTLPVVPILSIWFNVQPRPAGIICNRDKFYSCRIVISKETEKQGLCQAICDCIDISVVFLPQYSVLLQHNILPFP